MNRLTSIPGSTGEGVSHSRLVALVSGFALAAMTAAWAAATPPVYGHPRFGEIGIPVAMLVGLLCGVLSALGRPGRSPRTVRLALVVAGVSAAAAYFCLSGLEGPYRAMSGGFHGAALSSALGLAMVTAVVLVPTLLVGRAAAAALRTTQPAVTWFLLGAAVGALASVHLVLPALGSGAAMAIGAVALIAAGGISRPTGATTHAANAAGQAGPSDSPDPTGQTVPAHSPSSTCSAGSAGWAGWVAPLAALGIYGLSLAYLVLTWISILEQYVGSTAYFKASTLTVVLAAAALGSAFSGLLARGAAGCAGGPGELDSIGGSSSSVGLPPAQARAARVAAWVPVGVVMSLAGLLWFVPLVVQNDLPFIFMRFVDAGSPGWASLVAGQFGLGLVVLLAPCMLGGATVAGGMRPASVGRCADSSDRSGSPADSAGGRFAGTPARLAAVLAGCLVACAAYLVAPSDGLTTRAAATAAPWLAVAAGVGLLLPALMPAAKPIRGRSLAAAVAAAAVAASVAVTIVAPPWNKGIITAGSAVYAGRSVDLKDLRGTLEAADVAFYEESAAGITAVVGSTDGLALHQDGSTVGSTAEDMPSQIMAAHIPLLMAQDPRVVLVVGLGTGITVGSAEAHQLVQVDCVEPYAAVAAACRTFAPYNRDALSDSRLRLITCDPANYLLVARAKYDIITCGRPLPTPELVRLARACLAPSGMVCEVVDLAGLPAQGLASLAKEFAYHFPYVSLWWLGGRHVLIAGSMVPFRIDGQTLRTRLASPGVSQDLERLGTISYVGMLSMYIMGREALAEWASGIPAGPDTRDFLRYRATKATGGAGHVETLAGLEAGHQDPAAMLTDSEGNTAEATVVADQIRRCVDARGTYSRALTAISDRNLRQASAYMEAARSNCPENGIYAIYLSDFYLSLSRTLAQDKKSVEALTTGRRAVEANPASYRALYHLATLETKRDPTEAVRLMGLATRVNPAYLPAVLLEAEAEMAGGLVDRASETVARALSMRPFNARARHLRALSLIAKGQLEDARADLAFVVKSEPGNVAALAATAYTWMLENRLDRAQEVYEKALDMDSGNLEVLNNLGTVYAEKKQYAKAVAMWERALALAPNSQNIRDNLNEARQLLGEPR